MMYCLRTFLPLLLLPLPLSLSPIHLATLLALIYILNRPCVYCSFLLIILFASSCHWSGRCFWGNPLADLPLSLSLPSTTLLDSSNNTTAPTNWGWIPYFIPRLYTTPYTTDAVANHTQPTEMTTFLFEVANSTIAGLGAATAQSADDLLSRILPSIAFPPSYAAGGVGTGWLKGLLGRGEWTLPCVGVRVVL
jgi:hypothetical protein